MKKKKFRHTAIMFKLQFFVSALLFFSSVNAQELDSVRVTFKKGTQRGVVRVLNDRGILYIAINDAAKLCALPVIQLSSLKKFEIEFPQHRLKIVSHNPFIVLQNRSTKKQTITQIPVAITQQGEYWFASRYFVETMFRQNFDSSFTISPKLLSREILQPLVSTITKIDVDDKKNGILVRFHAAERITDFQRSMQLGEWLYVTLPNTIADTLALDTTFSTGIIRRIKPVQTGTSLQLSLQLRKKILTSDLAQDQTSNDVLLTLVVREEAKKDSAAAAKKEPEKPKSSDDIISAIKKQKEKWKLDVVVIDAGHGGHDPGAIGVIGAREKDVTLGIALKLGEMIERGLPEVKVVYTRKTDRFIELYRRGQIANEAGGKLFISIHCNSTEKKPSNAKGFEIYLLRPGKTEEAIRIAEKENEVVKLEKDFEERYQQLTEENFIILTMAQSAYVKQSETFAELLSETMSEKLESPDRAVKQAGFYVLVGASMPNVLVESGYLSNPREERFLRSPDGQKTIAESIFKAVKVFKRQYEKEL